MRGIILTVAVLSMTPSVAAQDLLIVLNKSDNTASILDAKTGVARATVPVGKAPHEVEVLADLGRLEAWRRRLLQPEGW